MIGAGVAGLVAARRLAQAGADVTVWEAEDRVGGQVHTVEVAPGTHLDLGAEALHLADPGAAALVAELGLGDTLVAAAPAATRLVTPRGLRPLPAGVGPAGPSRLGPGVRSRTLTWSGLARAGLEPAVARRMRPLADGADMSVGEFVDRRFGRAVTRAFVDPLLGTLHAGDVSRLSLRGCAPALVPAATGGSSLVLRRRPADSGPAFATWPRGLSALTSALVADQPRVTVRTGVAVTWLPDHVDGLVLAVPARTAAGLLGHLAPVAAATLVTVETADVATVVVGVPARAAGTLPGTGLLVPAGTGRLLKAATYLGHKWPHLADDETCWLRLSAGRAGDRRLRDLADDELVEVLVADLRDLTGFAASPAAAVVRRWPAALPQLTVGHPARVAAARAALPRGVVLAGASYDGLGLAAAIRSGEAAAAALSAQEAR
ncbi:protoporphyrinogen oxidase [Nocardioides aquiterrae]|uniref:Protoporphyrinogen oxidase n=1 Tax=Nocardioides aquiterrae TaxID=203799 RepID=A0ABN1U8B8_9ACTN